GRGLYGDGEVMVDPPDVGITAGLDAAVDAVAPTLAGCYDPTPAIIAPPVAQHPGGLDAVAGELGVTATGLLVRYSTDGADPATGTAAKAAIFEQWLATPARRFDGAETPVEALAASLGAHGRVDIDMIADLLACEPEMALTELAHAGLIYRAHDDPQRWEPA